MDLGNAPLSRIGLGTAQFGLDYGISNPGGRVSVEEVRRILAYAEAQGIADLDTAAAYGCSEAVLGEVLASGHAFRVVTKLSRIGPVRMTQAHREQTRASFMRSLERLRCSAVYALLIHDCDDILKPGGELLVALLAELKAEGLVRKIGISAYTCREVEAVLEHFTPDIVQLPINLLDQRPVRSGCLAGLYEDGIEVHARSVFLQGLLLMEPEGLPQYFEPIKDHLLRLRRKLSDSGSSPLEAALEYVMQQPEVNTVIIGVASYAELREMCVTAAGLGEPTTDYSTWALEDERFLNPSLWESADRRSLVRT